MKRYAKNFPDKLDGMDFETLEDSPHSIYALSQDLNLIYVNPGWVKFARENGAEDDFFEQYGLGTPIAKALGAGRIKEFYLHNYQRVLETREPWHHEYECSSATEYREYHQNVFPLQPGKGLIMVNTIMISFPMEETGRKPKKGVLERYVQPTGMVTQCTNCRHFLCAGEEESWDWVPEWVRNIPAIVSHSICPTCYDYYWKYQKG